MHKKIVIYIRKNNKIISLGDMSKKRKKKNMKILRKGDQFKKGHVDTLDCSSANTSLSLANVVFLLAFLFDVCDVGSTLKQHCSSVPCLLVDWGFIPKM